MEHLLQEGFEFCHKCNRETRWTLLRGKDRLRCEDCKDVFPCYYICAHLDCELVKKGNQCQPSS